MIVPTRIWGEPHANTQTTAAPARQSSTSPAFSLEVRGPVGTGSAFSGAGGTRSPSVMMATPAAGGLPAACCEAGAHPFR